MESDSENVPTADGAQDVRNDQAAESEQSNKAKWGGEIWNAGWTGVPYVLLDRQKRLGLNAQQMVVLLQLLKHWWRKDSLPNPSRKTLAEASGLAPATVQRHLTSLRKAGLIAVRRRKRGDGGYTSSEYSFEGLIEKLKPHASELIAERAERDAKRNTARRPRRSRKVTSP